jgi:hypothetical protein
MFRHGLFFPGFLQEKSLPFTDHYSMIRDEIEKIISVSREKTMESLYGPN